MKKAPLEFLTLKKIVEYRETKQVSPYQAFSDEFFNRTLLMNIFYHGFWALVLIFFVALGVF